VSEVTRIMFEVNRDPEEVLCEALRVLLRYVRETPELGHLHEVLPGILHTPEKSRDASLLPAQKLSTSTRIPASDEPQSLEIGLVDRQFLFSWRRELYPTHGGAVTRPKKLVAYFGGRISAIASWLPFGKEINNPEPRKDSSGTY
jgi:hypothetical protein